MKRIVTLFIVFMISVFSVSPAYAADGKITYDGNAKEFIFEPGGEQSPTDLFPNFKGVMPGDTLSQKITVKNDVSNEVKVEIYIRSLGAQQGSEEFLSMLGLKVKKSEENSMAYMFNAVANETAQLTDWVHLGTLYSGGEVNLDVILEVPVELDNEFQHKVGYLDWEFKVEEFPVEDTDPKPPETGDDSDIGLWSAIALGALILLVVLLVWRKRKHEQDENLAII